MPLDRKEIPHSKNPWWNPPQRNYSDEEIEALRRKMEEAMRELLKQDPEY
jgi:hypothetical protein